MNSIDDSPVPKSGSFLSRPTTRAGRLSGWMAIIAFVAVSASIILNEAFERQDSPLGDVLRVIVVSIFALGGISAFVLSLRGLFQGERSIVAWAAFVIGIFVTTLMVAEFTLIE